VTGWAARGVETARLRTLDPIDAALAALESAEHRTPGAIVRGSPGAV
jgi:hypothetical protein